MLRKLVGLLPINRAASLPGANREKHKLDIAKCMVFFNVYYFSLRVETAMQDILSRLFGRETQLIATMVTRLHIQLDEAR